MGTLLCGQQTDGSNKRVLLAAIDALSVGSSGYGGCVHMTVQELTMQPHAIVSGNTENLHPQHRFTYLCSSWTSYGLDCFLQQSLSSHSLRHDSR